MSFVICLQLVVCSAHSNCDPLQSGPLWPLNLKAGVLFAVQYTEANLFLLLLFRFCSFLFEQCGTEPLCHIAGRVHCLRYYEQDQELSSWQDQTGHCMVTFAGLNPVTRYMYVPVTNLPSSYASVRNINSCYGMMHMSLLWYA